MNTQDGLHPPIEPFAEGWLAVGDGHQIWVEQCGNPDGVPVLFIHGGPGSGCSPSQRRLFDPQSYRAILVDQRGCGRSLPLGGLDHNMTNHLVADFERVRRALGIARWLVFGGSWGSLLALRYAASAPAVVAGLVLRGIFLGSRAEIARYLGHAEDDPAAHQIVLCAAKAVLGNDPGLAEAVGCRWLNHERQRMGEPDLLGPLSAGQQAKVRIQLHYLAQECFVEQKRLFADVDRIRSIPAYLVQGLSDPVCPPVTATRLHAHWPEATFVGVPGAGHSGLLPEVASACQRALAALADQACLSGFSGSTA